MTRPVVVRTEFHRRLHRPGEDSPFRLARAIVPPGMSSAPGRNGTEDSQDTCADHGHEI